MATPEEEDPTVKVLVSMPKSYADALRRRAAADHRTVSATVTRALEHHGVVSNTHVDAASLRSLPALAADPSIPGTKAWRRAKSATAAGRAEIAAWEAK
jgi:hypothetical protein